MKFIFLLLSLNSVFVIKVNADDFPSLLMANASIAILLDREYLDTKYESTLTEVKVIIERVLREDLKNGGLYVYYYSWTMINFKKDFTAVLSLANCRDTWNVFAEARLESLLLIALTDPDCPRLPTTEAVMIPIMTPGEELPQVVLDMKHSNAFNWKSAVLLHDDTFDRDMISRAIIALSSESPDGSIKPLSISIFKLNAHIHEWERRKSLRKTLLSLPTRFIGTNFIVIVTTATMENLMETAKDLGMVHPFSKWLYIISDTNEIKNNISSVQFLITEGDNVAFAYNLTRHDPSCIQGFVCHAGEVLKAFVLALSQAIKEEKSIYGQISDEEWETIRQTKKEKRNNMLEFMKNYLKERSICANCTTWKMETGEIWGNIYDTKFTALNVLTDNWDAPPPKAVLSKLINVGFWKPSCGFQKTDFLFPHISHGFRNKQLHIVTFHNPPWQIISYNESGGVAYTGLTIDILNELSQKLNFTYALHIVSVNSNLVNESESLISTNTSAEQNLPTINIPSEIINIVGSNKVFLAATGVTVNERYKQIVNFTTPISIQSYTFIVSRPKELTRIFLFLSPFATDTWLCIACAIALMSPLLYIVHRLSPYYEHFRIRRKGGLNTMNNCFWYVYGALLQQGGVHLPKADSGRLIIGTWWIVVIIIVTTYCGNLVAYLTFPKIEIPITTVNQLLRHVGSVSWSVKGGTFLEEYLKETDFPKHKRLANGASYYVIETPEMIESVRQGKHILFDWKSNLQHIMKKDFVENGRCDFVLANEDFLDEQISLIMPKSSPYLNLVNREIKRMKQMGFVQRWQQKYVPKKDRCWNYKITAEITNHTVNINDMQGCFMVLMLGVAAAMVIIFIEYLWHRHQTRKERKLIKPFVQ